MLRLLLALALSLAPLSGALAQQGVASGMTVTATGGTTAQSLADHFPNLAFTVADFGAPTNGTSDATAAISAALTAAATAGGGKVFLGPHTYAVSNLTIPPHVALIGGFQPGGSTTQQATVSCYVGDPFTLRVSGTVTMSSGSALKGLELQASNYACATSLATMISLVDGYAGTAITVSGNDVWIQDTFVIAFAQAVSASHSGRLHIDNMIGDNTAGIYLDNSHDTSKINNVHFWNYLTQLSANTTSYAVSAVADNGSGLIRLTTATNTFTTGQVIVVSGVGGLTAANNRWTATAVDTTHVDLQGSSFAGPTPTGNTTNGSAEIAGLSSMANIAVGQGISGTGIPGGATIISINSIASEVTISANATATNTATALTITNPAYTSGGAAYVTEGWLRTGEAFHVSNSEGMEYSNISEFGYSTGFHNATGATWTDVHGFEADGNFGGDPNTIGILCDGTAAAGSFTGGFISAYGRPIAINTSFGDNSAEKFMNMAVSAAAGPYTVALYAQSAIFLGNGFQGGKFYVADGTQLYLGLNEVYGSSIIAESPTALASVFNTGPTLSGALTGTALFTGTYPNRGVNTNIDKAGTGGFVLNSHDGTATGGNAVGSQAIDLSLSRNNAAHEASGAWSFNTGVDNTASGNISAVFGNANTSSGTDSFVTGVFAMDHGLFAAKCSSSGALSGLGGGAQTCEQHLRGQVTTGAPTTAVRLTADGAAAGAANCMNMPNNFSSDLRVHLMARNLTAQTSEYEWMLPNSLYTVDSNASSTAITLGTPVILTRGTTSGAAVALTADTTNGCINITFTPPTSNVGQWDVVADAVMTMAQ